ncbi:MAG: hypothetical protein IBX62_09505 [Coriobacteriia bacterium]|nr:hypothetical protein [Coriobacteriia bacterium]
MNQRRDVTDEDIGMRAFQIRKAKAVERAVERLRFALKSDWPSFSDREIEELEWVLGELWAYVARDTWEHLRFGRVTTPEVRSMISKGREMRSYSRNAVEVLQEVGEIIAAKGD